MIYFIGTIMTTSTIWEVYPYYDTYLDDGITISFSIPYQLESREAINYLKQNLQHDEKQWLKCKKGGIWELDLSIFREKHFEYIEYGINPRRYKPIDPNTIFPEIEESNITLDMFSGVISLSPEVDQKDERRISKTVVKFVITYEDLMEAKPRKIFLSHKSSDKAIVRDFKETLVLLGYEPWIDEEHLVAGDKLHRGILKGFKDSCAAIFFITSNFKDTEYLSTEIDYAIQEATERRDGFRIITLVFPNNDNELDVPHLLKQYVYKKPNTELEALREIIKALPK